MAEKPALNPDTSRQKRGRPTRQEEVRRALAEIGCDPASVDPKRVLASIAGDAAAPASARVAAAKALLRQQAGMRPRRGKTSKKVLAQRAAARAGRENEWGADLAWRGGRPE